jgi:hypothetical protein
MADGIKNHYAILGVRPQASSRDILKARNRLLHLWHPDVCRGNPNEAKEMTLDILLASEVLLDDNARAEYDKIYRIHFPVLGKKRKDRGRSYASAIHEEAQEHSTIFIVCPLCGRKNTRSRRDYCMFCGAGIGENAKPFSWKDVNVNSPAFKVQLHDSTVDYLISHLDILFIVAVATWIICDAIIEGVKPRGIISVALIFGLVIYLVTEFRD